MVGEKASSVVVRTTDKPKLTKRRPKTARYASINQGCPLGKHQKTPATRRTPLLNINMLTSTFVFEKTIHRLHATARKKYGVKGEVTEKLKGQNGRANLAK